MSSLKEGSYFCFLLLLYEISVRKFQNSVLTFYKIDFVYKEGEIHGSSIYNNSAKLQNIFLD